MVDSTGSNNIGLKYQLAFSDYLERKKSVQSDPKKRSRKIAYPWVVMSWLFALTTGLAFGILTITILPDLLSWSVGILGAMSVCVGVAVFTTYLANTQKKLQWKFGWQPLKDFWLQAGKRRFGYLAFFGLIAYVMVPLYSELLGGIKEFFHVTVAMPWMHVLVSIAMATVIVLAVERALKTVDRIANMLTESWANKKTARQKVLFALGTALFVTSSLYLILAFMGLHNVVPALSIELAGAIAGMTFAALMYSGIMRFCSDAAVIWCRHKATDAKASNQYALAIVKIIHLFFERLSVFLTFLMLLPHCAGDSGFNSNKASPGQKAFVATAEMANEAAIDGPPLLPREPAKIACSLGLKKVTNGTTREMLVAVMFVLDKDGKNAKASFVKVVADFDALLAKDEAALAQTRRFLTHLDGLNLQSLTYDQMIDETLSSLGLPNNVKTGESTKVGTHILSEDFNAIFHGVTGLGIGEVIIAGTDQQKEAYAHGGHGHDHSFKLLTQIFDWLFCLPKSYLKYASHENANRRQREWLLVLFVMAVFSAVFGVALGLLVQQWVAAVVVSSTFLLLHACHRAYFFKNNVLAIVKERCTKQQKTFLQSKTFWLGMFAYPVAGVAAFTIAITGGIELSQVANIPVAAVVVIAFCGFFVERAGYLNKMLKLKLNLEDIRTLKTHEGSERAVKAYSLVKVVKPAVDDKRGDDCSVGDCQLLPQPVA